MGLMLGLNGKTRALDINKGLSVTPITTLYVGLLQSAPVNMDGMDLATLVHVSNGNEFSINGNFYTARKAITLGITTTNQSGAYAQNNNVSAIEWTNLTGSTINIPAFFITDVVSGTSGNIIWVGTPDAGTATIYNGAKASLTSGDLVIRVD